MGHRPNIITMASYGRVSVKVFVLLMKKYRDFVTDHLSAVTAGMLKCIFGTDVHTHAGLYGGLVCVCVYVCSCHLSKHP